MADGHTHFKMSMVVDASLGGALIWMAQEGVPVDVFNGVVVGATIGTLITPDFDLVGTTYTERLLRQIPILGLLLQVTWYPYALLSKHRGLSHVHLLGTGSRALYMLFALIVWTWLINGMFLSLHINAVQHLAGTIFDYCISNPTFTISMFAAWALHDEAHLLLDGKRKKKKTPVPTLKGQFAWNLNGLQRTRSRVFAFSITSATARTTSPILLKSIYIVAFSFGILWELSATMVRPILRAIMRFHFPNWNELAQRKLHVVSPQLSPRLSPMPSPIRS